MSLLSRGMRLFISAILYLAVLLVIVLYLMDVDPPQIVRLLLEPTEFLAGFVRLPCFNMGTDAHPICEGTPIHLLIGLMLVTIGSLFYPLITYLVLTVASGLIKLRGTTSLNLK